MAEIPEQAQHLIVQLQQYQNQMQAILMQKNTLEVQSSELDAALKALGELKEDSVYKAIGPVLVKTEKGKTVKELGEMKETMEVRVRALKKQEEKVREKLKELSDKLGPMIKG